MKSNFEISGSFEKTPHAVVKKELFGKIEENGPESADVGFRNLTSFVKGAYIGNTELKNIIKRCQPCSDPSDPAPRFANMLLEKTREILGVSEGDARLYTTVRSPFEKRGVHALVELNLLAGKEPVVSNLEVAVNQQVGEHGNNVVFYFPKEHLDPDADAKDEEYAAKVYEVAIKIALDAVKQLRGVDLQFADIVFDKVKDNICDSLVQTIEVMKKSKRFEYCNFIVSDILKQTKEISPSFAFSAMDRIKNKFIE